MAKKQKVTDKKIMEIESWTGGKIRTHTFEGGSLKHSFMSNDEQHYIGDFQRALWYLKHNLVTCKEQPAGVAIRLKEYVPTDHDANDEFDEWFAYQVKIDNIMGYHGYTHRGGNTFKIGDRLFDSQYKVKQEDFTKEEWTKFVTDRIESVEKNVKEGCYATDEEGYKDTPIEAVINFNMRGSKIIENWDEALQAAKNMSDYLS